MISLKLKTDSKVLWKQVHMSGSEVYLDKGVDSSAIENPGRFLVTDRISVSISDLRRLLKMYDKEKKKYEQNNSNRSRSGKKRVR